MTSMIDALGNDLRETYPDLWLGSLMWYYVPSDAEIATDDWIIAVENAGMSEMAPAKPRPVDAFKRAIRKIGTTGKVKAWVEDEEVSFKFMSRDSGQAEDWVYRDLVVERLGRNKLSYGPVVKFSYARGNAEMDHSVDDEIYDVLPGPVQAEIDARIERAYEQYRREQFVLGPMKIRELVRTEIEERQVGISCKPGKGSAVYFVFDNHLDRVSGLTQVFEALASHGVSFHTLPVVDVESQRDMIMSAFRTGTLGEVDQLMHDMAEAIRGNRGRITKDAAQRYINDFTRLKNRLSTFS